MKIISFAILLMLFFSCRKDNVNSPQDSGKKYSVEFNVAAFSQHVTKFEKLSSLHTSSDTSSIDSLKALTSYIYYFVYDNNGDFVHSIKQDDPYKNNINFGTISDLLAPGTYTIVILAASRALFSTTNDFNAMSTMPLSTATIQLSKQSTVHFYDTFFKKFNLEIVDNGISEDVRLDRIVGQLQIKINDLSEEDSYSVRVKDKAAQFSFNSPTVSGYTDTWYNDVSVPNLSLLTMNVYSPFSVTILGNNGAIRTIDNVRVYPNKITELSGSLFSESSSSGDQSFNITVNDTWGSDTTKINY